MVKVRNSETAEESTDGFGWISYYRKCISEVVTTASSLCMYLMLP